MTMKMSCKLWVTMAALILAARVVPAAAQAEPVWMEDFESSTEWTVEGGVWEIGTPTAANGPMAHSGTKCAGTILAGNYPHYSDARLVSPEFMVPAAAANPQLSFWHWFNIVGGDGGRVQIKPRGGAWTDASTLFVGVANAWNRNLVDLAPFAGQVVQVGFRFGSDYGNEAAGWYIDDVALATFVPNPLALGGTVTNHFTANGERAYYVIDVPPGGHLRITLNDLDNIGSNELYIRRGAPPTAGEYDYRYSIKGGADQEIFVPDAGAGRWYIMVYGSSVPVPGDFTPASPEPHAESAVGADRCRRRRSYV